MNIESDVLKAKIRIFCFKNFKKISHTFRAGRLVRGGGGEGRFIEGHLMEVIFQFT
jgi:hypothetical protein